MPAIHVPVALRWGDQDPYGHVNNVSVLRLLEEARARAFWTAGPMPPLRADEPLWALVASIDVRYVRPLDYSADPVHVELSTRRVNGASFVIDYAVRSSPGGVVRVTANSTIVVVDAVSGAPRRIDVELRRSLKEFSLV